MIGMEKNSEEFLLCMQRFEEIYAGYVDNGLLETVMSMYNLIIRYIGSMWGNKGKYDKADKYNEIIRQGCLRFRINGTLHDSIYDRWWNNMKRREKGIPVEKILDAEKELRKCIVLSMMDKNTDQNFYEKMLKSEREKYT